MTSTTTSFRTPSRERGAALIFGLILLAALTLTGLAGARDSVLQELMAAATRDRNTAFQAAESALREAEAEIGRLRFGCGYEDVLPPEDGGHQVPLEGGGFLQIWDEDAAGLPDPWNAESWTEATAYGGSLGGVPSQPRYTVEVVGSDDNTATVQFRITAAGRGARDAVSVVQSRMHRSFERVIRIRGQDAINVVAIGDGVLTAQASFGTQPTLDISLGGWDPGSCADTNEPVTIIYQGNGGADTFVIADIADLGYAPGVNGMVDLTSQLTALDRALADYRIQRIVVENEGSTAVAISTLNQSGRFMEDNHYCINTGSGDAGSGVLNRLGTELVGRLLPDTPLDSILGAVVGSGNNLVGSGGIVPILPASASIIIDGGGNDVHEIYTDTSSAALVIANLAGNDHYRLHATGDGFINLPVIIDGGGNDTYDIEGGSAIKVSLDAGALSDLGNLLDSSSTNDLMNNLSNVVNLFNGSSCSPLLGLLCWLLNSLASNFLPSILDGVTGLFDSEYELDDDAPSAHQAGRCLPVTMHRTSWREVFQ